MDIKWHDVDPESGERRYLCAERFAGVWAFKWKLQRRGDWTKNLSPTREMWEHILDTLQRRFWRRQGVEEADITQVKRILADVIRDEERRAGDD
ncbi:MAG: hypothetical protein K2X38_10640 [Gemmataceae bacterium]|nr:hypothetical protein [Gemmataceae bacterium]